MRRSSLSTRHGLPDPYEKPGRYNRSKDSLGHPAGILEKVKADWMTQSQRSRYLKTGGIIFFIVFLFYYLAPSGAKLGSGGSQDGQTASDPSLGTTRCSKSSDPSKPIIQYALMIDAGSTGSRIHVYRFNNCGPTPYLEDEVFKMTERKAGGSGLSSYKEDAEGAAKSLDVLMEEALKTVPDKLKPCSPVAVKATAGLRLLGEEMSQKILDAVRTRLETEYPFPVVSREENGVVIMDGKDEGVYAWITTNYLLGKIGGPDHSETAAVFDLGGGSTQIVFEPTFKSPSGGMPEKMAQGDHKYDLSFGGRAFELYQHSHLGYGLMSARKAIHKVLIDGLHQSSPNDQSWTKKPVTNPCIAPGMNRTVTVELGDSHPLGETLEIAMHGPSSPSAAQCRGLAEKILEKESACTLAPCSFKGVHQPSLEKTFAREDIYTFSYFYDRTQPLGMPDSFTLKELHDLTSQVCGGKAHWDMFSSIPGALDELQGRPEHCLDLNFMMALLHTGYEMPIDREVKIAKKIKGNELGWCLGASLPLLSKGSGWQCKIRETS
ncbi:MAG: Guanosine-diphosphatase [Claussenomyces sp. TS43310]|nr:MAG: Guanosine-diphosphatase [Claussenomyces sp. TS43310]